MQFICNPFNDPSSPWYYVVGVAFLLLIFAALAVYIVIENKRKSKKNAEAGEEAEQSAAANEQNEAPTAEPTAAEAEKEQTIAAEADNEPADDKQVKETEDNSDKGLAEEAADEPVEETAEETVEETPTAEETATEEVVKEEAVADEAVTETTATEEKAEEQPAEEKEADEAAEGQKKAERAAAVDVVAVETGKKSNRPAAKRAQKPKKPKTEEDENKISTVKKVETVVDKSGKKLRYNRSFEAIIIQSDDRVKDYYSELKNSLMAFSDNTRMSRTRESYNVGKRNCAARLTVRRNKLCMMIDADPKAYTGSTVEDMSDKKSYAKTPCLCRIDDDESKERAVEIIENALGGKYERASVQKTDYRPKYESTQSLVERELIREKEVVKKQK
ncbi:MAG: hypothetical protein NC184_01645 [Roseburia sp.]|nr:hypothetical protein [Roseburia sp.]